MCAYIQVIMVFNSLIVTHSPISPQEQDCNRQGTKQYCNSYTPMQGTIFLVFIKDKIRVQYTLQLVRK